MIKILKMELTYLESNQRFELDVNGKKVVAFRYQKQDPQFNDYDLDVEIQNKELLSEEEIEGVEELIEEEDI